MKIYGPYTRKDGRMHIIKYHNDKRTTQSYPRYLMEQYLNRKLLPEEHVDHIDEDFTNNNISNFQLLTCAANSAKTMSQSHRQAKVYIGICPICESSFEKPLNFVKHNKRLGKAGPFCSRSCAGKYSHIAV